MKKVGLSCLLGLERHSPHSGLLQGIRGGDAANEIDFTGNGNPLPYSCLGNTMDRRAWRATVHGVATEHACSKEQPHVAQSLENTRMVIRCGFVSMKIECPCMRLFVWLWICVCGGVPVSSGAISHSHSMIHLSRLCKKKKISSPLLTVCTVTHSSFTQLLLEMWIIFSLLGWRWGRRQMAQTLDLLKGKVKSGNPGKSSNVDTLDHWPVLITQPQDHQSWVKRGPCFSDYFLLSMIPMARKLKASFFFPHFFLSSHLSFLQSTNMMPSHSSVYIY